MRNPVAKNVRLFNKPHVQKDRKKASRRGYVKHRLAAFRGAS